MNILLGPTLSGKTTLMRMLAGLEQPTDGEIHWNGVDVSAVPVQKRDVAMVYQQYHQLPERMTVFDNIASPLQLKKQPRHVVEQAGPSQC